LVVRNTPKRIAISFHKNGNRVVYYPKPHTPLYNLVKKRNIPKRDGSGKGRRANRGRGGCAKTRKYGKR